ncbi:MAG: TatD family hydrolase [Spirochaetales bacterium]|nr:TatD family hydrolase [Spirochaetales bacterium]
MQQEALKHRLDAHLHLQTIPWNSCFNDLPGRDLIKSFLVKGSQSICNGTSPLDWELVASLTKLYPEELVPFYGVHPWYVDALPENWLYNLESCLVDSHAGLGEIGLDRACSSKASFDHQQDVFTAQLDLAVSLNLPVSLHCVRSWGVLLEILQDKILIKIADDKYSRIPVMIHSFSGSLETMKQLIDIGVYISFSPYLLSLQAEILREVFKAVPLERILIESDFSYRKNISINNQIIDYKRNLKSLYNMAGSLRDMSPAYFQEVVYKNGKVFTDRAINR